MKASNFEIYVKNPVTNETGWDIKFVTVLDIKDTQHARELLKEKYPFFDCVILHNWTMEVKEGKDLELWKLNSDGYKFITYGGYMVEKIEAVHK